MAGNIWQLVLMGPAHHSQRPNSLRSDDSSRYPQRIDYPAYIKTPMRKDEILAFPWTIAVAHPYLARRHVHRDRSARPQSRGPLRIT